MEPLLLPGCTETISSGMTVDDFEAFTCTQKHTGGGDSVSMKWINELAE